MISITITLDYLYEQKIVSKNKEDEPYYEMVQQIVELLCSKVRFLPGKYQELAKKVVKGLAFNNLIADGVFKGINIKELVEGLGLEDKEKDISKLLHQLREITGNQFIDYLDDDIFALDLVHTIDYDKVIRNKAKLYSKDDEIRGLKFFLKKAFKLNERKITSDNLYYDYFYWPGRKCYQKVVIAFNELEPATITPALIVNMVSPVQVLTGKKIILNLEYPLSLGNLIRELMVILTFSNTNNYPSAYLKHKEKRLWSELEDRLLSLLHESVLLFPGQKRIVRDCVGESKSLEDFYNSLKEKLFVEIFEKHYILYPVFPFEMTHNNIKEIVENIIIAFLNDDYTGVKGAREFLRSLSLFDQQGNLDISSSDYCKRIIDFLKKESLEMVPINEIISLLEKEPYGLQKEITYLLLVILAYLGELSFYKEDRIEYQLDQIEKYFLNKKTLFSFGLDKMESINYIKANKYQISGNLEDLFSLLGLDEESYNYNKHLLFKEYMKKINILREKINKARNYLEEYMDIPIPGIEENFFRIKIEDLDKNILAKLFAIDNIPELMEFSLNDFELEELEIFLLYINNLLNFLDNLNTRVVDNYRKVFLKLKSENKQKDLEKIIELMQKTWQEIDNKELFSSLESYLKILL